MGGWGRGRREGRRRLGFSPCFRGTMPRGTMSLTFPQVGVLCCAAGAGAAFAAVAVGAVGAAAAAMGFPSARVFSVFSRGSWDCCILDEMSCPVMYGRCHILFVCVCLCVRVCITQAHVDPSGNRGTNLEKILLCMHPFLLYRRCNNCVDCFSLGRSTDGWNRIRIYAVHALCTRPFQCEVDQLVARSASRLTAHHVTCRFAAVIYSRGQANDVLICAARTGANPLCIFNGCRHYPHACAWQTKTTTVA